MKRFFIILISVMTIMANSGFSTEKSESHVYVIPLHGPIDTPQFYIIQRAFRQASSEKATAVVLEVDTPGGSLQQTEDILNWIRSFDGKVYSFVSEHAQSAGAIICLGTDKVFMAPGSRIGSAAPVMATPTGVAEIPPTMKAKVVSDTRAMVRGLAQENNYPELLAEAMVDESLEYESNGVIISKAGELLNLTAKEALNIKTANGDPAFVSKIYNNMDELLKDNFKNPIVTKFEVSAAEKLAQWITLFAPILLIIGGLGLFIEFKTPGFGVFGIGGIIFLSIFFFGHYIAGIAGHEELVLIVIGLILLLLEIFVIPGFGIAGVLGILSLLTGFTLAMVNFIPADGFGSFKNVGESLNTALMKMSISLFMFLLLAYLVIRLFPKTKFGRGIVLDRSVGNIEEDLGCKVGDIGVTNSFLRPAGIVKIGPARIDVITQGEMIDKNKTVQVIAIQGHKITVKEIDA